MAASWPPALLTRQCTYTLSMRKFTSIIYSIFYSHQYLSIYLFVLYRGKLCKLKSWRFPTTPESVCFAPSSRAPESNGDGNRDGDGDGDGAIPIDANEVELIIGLRDSSELVYMSCSDYTQRQVSLNERAWDSHPSFVPLQLSLSPDRRYLLVATDKSMHVVLRLGTNIRVRTLAAHSTGEFGKPRVRWDTTGRYVYCNSDSEHAVFVYSLSSERVVCKLVGHTGSVRDAAVHGRYLASCSFDKSVILWSR